MKAQFPLFYLPICRLILICLFKCNLCTAQVNNCQVGDRFPIDTFRSISNKLWSLDSTESKLLVMNFWNVGCRGCEQEKPFLNEMKSTFSEKDLDFWSITMNSAERLTDYLTSHPTNWELVDAIDFMGLTGDSTWLINCMPTTIVLDENRIIRYKQCGPLAEENRIDSFRRLLAGLLDR